MVTRRMHLYLVIRGERYKITREGWIIRTDISGFKPSGQWKFLGVSVHFWQDRITHTFEAIWKDPKLAIGGYLWDTDHGTIRQWGGSYQGKAPRITAAWKRLDNSPTISIFDGCTPAPDVEDDKRERYLDEQKRATRNGKRNHHPED